MSQAGTTHHQFAEGYSGRNPVPTVQAFREQQAGERAHPAPPSPPTPETDSDTAVTSPTTTVAGGGEVNIDKDLPPKPAPTPAAVSNDVSKQLNGGASPDQKTNGEVENKKKETKGESKEEVMAKANANKVKPTDRLKNSQAEHVARDPVTGLDVVIQNAEFSCASSFFVYGFIFVARSYPWFINLL